MAADLHKLLEPGERVVHRDPTWWVPRSWHADLAMVGLVTALGFAFGHGQFATILVLAIYGLGWALQAIRASTCWDVVTDRRILQKSGWRRPEINDIRLAEVTAVEFRPADFPGTVRVQTRDGGETDLWPLDDPQAFAVAAADAAGVKRPALIGCLMNMLPYLGPFGGILIPCLVLIGLMVFTWFILPEGVIAEGSVLLWVFVLSIPFGLLFVYLSFPIGVYVACLVGIAILRPFATFEQVRNAIDTGFWFDPAQQPPDRLARLYLRWIGLLYGRPMQGNADAEARDGG